MNKREADVQRKREAKEKAKRELQAKAKDARDWLAVVAPIIGDYYHLPEGDNWGKWVQPLPGDVERPYRWARDLSVWFLVVEFGIPLKAVKIAFRLSRPGRGVANVEKRRKEVAGFDWFISRVRLKVEAAVEGQRPAGDFSLDAT